MGQHIYFKENEYEQQKILLEMRNKLLVAMRRSMYNLLIMRSFMEIQVHLDKEETVTPPDNPVIDQTLKDHFDFDIVGAATIGLHDIKYPKPPDPWAHQLEVPEEVQRLSRRDRIDIYLESQHQALDNLESPRVVPSVIVASALKRIALLLKDHTLSRASAERLDEGEVYYPISISRPNHFRRIAGIILHSSVGLADMEEHRVRLQGLQTGVNTVELAA